MRPSVRSASAIALAILALTPHSSAEGVHIVGAPGLGPFDELQQAVDAAAPGDTLLVAGGQYTAFTIAGKALFVRAAPGQVVRVHGPVVVRDLAPAQVVVLAGLTVDAPAPSAPVPEGLPALVGLDIAGHLRLEDCSLRAASGFPAPFTGTSFGAGGDGLRLVDCAQVGLLGCTLAGGAGGGASQGASVDAGGRGGAGVRASGATRLALHECDLRGGAGGSSLGSGGDGGHALWLQGQGAFAAGGVLLGGSGGHALGTDCSRPPGNGGHGVHIGAVTETQSKGASFAGGSPGLGLTCGGSGAPGEPTAGPGLFVPFAELPRVLEADAVVAAGESLKVRVHGTPGDRVWLAMSSRFGFSTHHSTHGVWFVPYAAHFLASGSHGVLPANGVLDLVLPAPTTGARAERWLVLQAYLIEGVGGPTHLSGARHVLALERSAGPDCDGNGSNDWLDVLEGTHADCQPDLVPDPCGGGCAGG